MNRPEFLDDHALMETSLEIVAASGVDIVAEYFARFFTEFPDQRDSFQRPQVTQGAMVGEMLEYLLAQVAEKGWVYEAYSNCTERHESYANIAFGDFGRSLQILLETLAFAAGKDWRPEFELAWSRQIQALERYTIDPESRNTRRSGTLVFC